MIPDGNMDGHKEKKSIRNGKCVDKHEKIFFFLFISFQKGIDYLKQK